MTVFQGRVSLDNQGCPFSPEFGDVYASRDGAVEQSRFVFLNGNNLPKNWKNKSSFTVLENGFGLGTNFLTTLQAWRKDSDRSEKLFYASIEGYPVSREDLIKFAAPELSAEAEELAEKWPLLTPGVHRLEFDEGKAVLDLYFMPAETAAKRLSCSFDALYLDGFSPKKNPEMWSPRLLKKLCAHAKEGATLSTWCVASSVRRALFEAGFEIEKVPGFGHKSEMTVGRFEPRFKSRRSATFSSGRVAVPKSVMVIGAGLSGSAVAHVLSKRGMTVTVVDSGPVGATGASALRYGVVHAQPSADDNRLFRLTRAGLERLQRELKQYPGVNLCRGLFQMARDPGEFERWQAWARDKKPFAFTEEFLKVITAEEAEQKTGIRPRFGGLWHGHGGPIALAQWVRDKLERSGAALLFNTRIALLRKNGKFWEASDVSGRVVTRAECAVLCCAAGTSELVRDLLPLTQWKGRISLISDSTLGRLKGAITGPGYAIHSPDGWSGVGATYERAEEALSAQEAHAKNLEHLKQLCPSLRVPGVFGFYEGFRCVAPDRLPVIGKIISLSEEKEVENLYVSCAMGSRGTVFNQLAAEIIESMIFNEPIPLESDLVEAVSPMRFVQSKK